MTQREKGEVLEALQELSRFLDDRMDERFDSLDCRMEALHERLSALALRVELLEGQVAGLVRVAGLVQVVKDVT